MTFESYVGEDYQIPMDKFQCFSSNKDLEYEHMSQIWHYIHGTFCHFYSLTDKKGKEDMHGNFRSDKASFRTKLEATLDFP